jgi:outer membrane protein OmpA-like peptidoglycan-associated protein
MKGKIINLLLCSMFCLVLSSCCEILPFLCDGGDRTTEGANHKYQKDVINKMYKDCLASAQSKEDSAACEEKRDARMDEENERHENMQAAIKEKDNYQDCVHKVLDNWGYSSSESNDIARTLRKTKGDNFSFECEEVIKDLIERGCIDKKAIPRFAESLEKHGLSKDLATKITTKYYKDEVFSEIHKSMYSGKNQVTKCIDGIPMGNGIDIEKALKAMDYLDDDSDDDDDDEDDDTDNNKDEEGNGSNTHSSQTDPNVNGQDSKGKPDEPVVKEPIDNYKEDAKAISRTVIGGYALNKVELSPEQRHELDVVADFMKKWPETRVTIFGHTCNIGTDKANQKVGLQRAHLGKMYLVSQGISEERIEEVSKAATEPCASNDTESGRQKNRRITFAVK